MPPLAAAGRVLLGGQQRRERRQQGGLLVCRQQARTAMAVQLLLAHVLSNDPGTKLQAAW